MKGALELYRLLLRILPADFRERNAGEMAQITRDLMEGGSGPRSLIRWIQAYWDIVVQAVRLRLPGRGRARGAPEGGTASRRIPRVLDGVLQDLLFAFRSLQKRLGFATVTALILSLGIGATTTIFSVVNGVLIRPLPYASSNRIGVLWHHFGAGAQSLPVLNPLDAWDYREWSETFEALTFGTGGFECRLAFGYGAVHFDGLFASVGLSRLAE